MKKRKSAIIVAVLLMVPLFVTPAVAFYFDFQGFVTDKLVYEIGETINMAADLIADFGAEGWCYVSFAVTGNEGPLHFEEYNITPAPTVRTFNSSGVILPSDISPGVDGVQAFAHFFSEIYDTVQQSDGDTITLTIMRGHLSLTPLTDLTIPSDSNTTITIRLASVHDSSIVSPDANATVIITDSSLSTVLNTTVTSDELGLLHIDWIDSMGSIGTYNLSISGSGTEDFLPFVEYFSLEVIPPESSLIVADAPASVYCQSPNATQYETAIITVRHEDVMMNPITDSIINWTTSFGNGNMLHSGNGYYTGLIPIHANPGQLKINVSTSNPAYQDTNQTLNVEVLPNPTQVTMESNSLNITQGETLILNFTMTEFLNWNEPISIQFHDDLGEITLARTTTPGIPTSTDWVVPANTTPGRHTMSAIVNDIHYNLSEACVFDINIIGSLHIDVSNLNGTYGNKISFNINAYDAMNATVTLISYEIYCDGGPSPIGSSFGLVNSTEYQQVALPLSISPGNHTFTFVFSSSYFETIQISLDIQIWMETNISIIIEPELGNGGGSIISLHHTEDFIWGYHESTTNLIHRSDFCMTTCCSTNLSYHLTKI